MFWKKKRREYKVTVTQGERGRWHWTAYDSRGLALAKSVASFESKLKCEIAAAVVFGTDWKKA